MKSLRTSECISAPLEWSVCFGFVSGQACPMNPIVLWPRNFDYSIFHVELDEFMKIQITK